jgi:hypothetical protein
LILGHTVSFLAGTLQSILFMLCTCLSFSITATRNLSLDLQSSRIGDKRGGLTAFYQY